MLIKHLAPLDAPPFG